VNLRSLPAEPLPVRVQREIRDIVAQGVRAGLNPEDVAQNIMARFDWYRDFEAHRIARTEAHWASQRTISEAIKESPVIVAKEWVAVGDERTRETHLELDGTRVGKDELFNVGGIIAEGPGMTGDPAEDINCRCQLVEVTELREEIEKIDQELE
jgi:SPP1 gp7 family putative phage head morphogenesis protein